MEGTRALAQGNFDYKLSEDGVEEIRELSRAFDRMRIELRRTQSELIDSERLATIGRMASSISHDLQTLSLRNVRQRGVYERWSNSPV